MGKVVVFFNSQLFSYNLVNNSTLCHKYDEPESYVWASFKISNINNFYSYQHLLFNWGDRCTYKGP